MISALSYPFLAIYNSCAALFRSMGNSRISMQASIVMNIVNVAGDAWLIFGMGWGVAGAAIASLASRIQMCIRDSCVSINDCIFIVRKEKE